MSLAPTVSAAPSVQSRALSSVSAEAVSVPWTIWFIVIGAAVSLVGATLDLAWHKSIGREAFFTPGHIMIGAGVAGLGGIGSVYCVPGTTRGGPSPRGRSTSVPGVYGAAGAVSSAFC